MTTSNDDDALLLAYRNGNDEAFSYLTQRYHALVLTACRRQVAQADVDDCVQAVFLVLARKPAAAARAKALAAWLHNVCHCVCRDARRAAQRRQAAMNQIEPPKQQKLTPEATVLAQLDDALQQLNEQQRAAVLLYAENSSAEEIAQRIGVTKANAYKLTQRGLFSLRNYLVRNGAPVGAAALITLLSTQSASATTVATSSLTVLLSQPTTSTIYLLTHGASMNLTIATVKTALTISSLTLALGLSAVFAADALTPTTPQTQPISEKTIAATDSPDQRVVRLKVNEMRISDAIKWVSRLTNTYVDLDRTLADQRISFDIQERPLAEALAEIAKLVDGTVQADKEDDHHFTIVPAPTIAAVPKADVAKEPATDFPPITIKVEAMKAQYLVDFMEKLSGAIIRIDPELQNQEMTLDIQDPDFLVSLNAFAKLLDGKVQTVANKPNEFEIVPNHTTNNKAPAPAAEK
jgi:RNA polymerase sigma factor (sigma-70 family)